MSESIKQAHNVKNHENQYCYYIEMSEKTIKALQSAGLVTWVEVGLKKKGFPENEIHITSHISRKLNEDTILTQIKGHPDFALRFCPGILIDKNNKFSIDHSFYMLTGYVGIYIDEVLPFLKAKIRGIKNG